MFKGIMYQFQYVKDLEKSAKFYGEKLGFEPGTNEKDVRGYKFGDGYMVLHRDNRKKGKGRFQGGAYTAVHVEDVDAYRALLRKRKVKASAIKNWPWGERSFTVEDPDGYLWTFASIVKT